jgi:hypothetical protein
MAGKSKEYSIGPRRRLPPPYLGLDVNCCRNVSCGQFAIAPDPFDGRGRSRGIQRANFHRGRVIGSNDETTFVCDACGSSSVVTSNRAIVEDTGDCEHHNSAAMPTGPANQACRSYCRSVVSSPSL